MAPHAVTLGSAAARPRGFPEVGLSIVVPLFNEANSLATLHARIVEIARALKRGRGLATEVVYVDDGSRDAQAASRAQQVLQGARKLDRIPPNPRRLRAG